MQSFLLVFVVATTFFPIVASIVALDFATPYTSFPIGCHTFEGKISCGNGNPILSDAKITLFDKDFITGDDKLVEDTPHGGVFVIHKCATDFPTPNLELYFQFVNICQKGDKKQSGILKENAFMEYVIYDNEKFAHTAINDNK
uniref:Uncharacterized protein n=1 Tax=Panagrolaimus superbus TaxID=310955 RepID=A0A914YPB1_9BILA